MPNLRRALGTVVAGVLALVVYVYADDTKMIINNFASQVLKVPPQDVGFYIVLGCFLIAFLYFGGLSVLSIGKWAYHSWRKPSTRLPSQEIPGKLEITVGVPATITFSTGQSLGGISVVVSPAAEEKLLEKKESKDTKQ